MGAKLLKGSWGKETHRPKKTITLMVVVMAMCAAYVVLWAMGLADGEEKFPD